MSLSAHLAELTERHKHLKEKIEVEAARPGSDDLEIRRMKQEKLRLKEEIARLSGDVHTAARH